MIDAEGANNYLAAVVDLNLPDAPNGEVVDYTLAQGIPTIILTGSFDEQKRAQMLEKPIVDYVVKESKYSYQYVLKLVRRLDKNRSIKVLVADDSATSRKFVTTMLRSHLYQVVEASDGLQAIEILKQQKDIKLLITDHHMPHMTGTELVNQLRRELDKSELIIIGLSTQGSGTLSARFIKSGANDFLAKPFSPEEFHCRIIHNIEMMEQLELIKHAANHDFLTGLKNRRHFYEAGSELLQQCQQSGTPVSLALLDLDHFKAVNDKYGHEVGDLVLLELSAQLVKVFDRFMIARLGGEEFALLIAGLSIDKANILLENFRESIEDHIILLQGDSLSFTFSAGLALAHDHNLNDLLNEADRQLYEAKTAGRNVIMVAR